MISELDTKWDTQLRDDQFRIMNYSRIAKQNPNPMFFSKTIKQNKFIDSLMREALEELIHPWFEKSCTAVQEHPNQ